MHSLLHYERTLKIVKATLNIAKASARRFCLTDAFDHIYAYNRVEFD